MVNDRKFYINELKGDECQCGRDKKSTQALCWYCYRRLPQELQTNLYQPIGAGYEDAYDEAVQWLNN